MGTAQDLGLHDGVAGNQITEVQNISGEKFRLGQLVAHQDEDVGVAYIKSFRLSPTHAPEIQAITDQGNAHIDFITRLPIGMIVDETDSLQVVDVTAEEPAEESTICRDHRKLRDKITSLLNCCCVENESNTPDFILAQYMLESLHSFERATQQRDKWYGVHLEPCNKYFVSEEPTLPTKTD